MICFRVIPLRCAFPGAFLIMGKYYRKVASLSSHFATLGFVFEGVGVLGELSLGPNKDTQDIDT